MDPEVTKHLSTSPSTHPTGAKWLPPPVIVVLDDYGRAVLPVHLMSFILPLLLLLLLHEYESGDEHKSDGTISFIINST